MPTHEGDDVLFLQAELEFNGLEGGAVLPGHLNDPVLVLIRERRSRHLHPQLFLLLLFLQEAGQRAKPTVFTCYHWLCHAFLCVMVTR